MQAGKVVGLVFGALVVAAAAVAVAYTLQDHPDRSMAFQRVAAAPENTTVHAVEFKPVHAAFFLEDHLDTAVLRGTSEESIALRVESMQATLQTLTGHAGPEWWLEWQGATVHVVLVSEEP